MAFTIILAVALSLLLWPTEALAWGIGIHLQLGSHILDKLHLLPAALQTLLMAHPQDFLYGCISADITIGKKFTHYLNHCHSWRLGRKILAASVTDRQKACAYGYITHLAADTIAHSYFVPFKMVRSFNTVMLNHAYWELRFEAEVPREVWSIARNLARLDFRENDTMMRSVLADTIFSFNTNKRIFNSLLLLNRLQQWQKVLRSLSSTSRFELPETSRREYFGLACEAAESVLMLMDESPYWKADPTGERAIAAARMIRKNLHLLWLEGKISDAEAQAIVNGLKQRFREGIIRPKEVLDLLSNA
ncbi:zinc dependent phospholipase C family protein [Geoalkalibacter sp.]|uniref:zinc dependent phospholipase C family protein n=1 Tax=Geoalkalibacter sp. TaxID=3041440 RepID=UPI00272E7B8F|nr:zinc dependent phospholipase C family protein [Geoalkalibacter sp.]